ncbi:hypothetical protein AAG570_006564 [Ranatra chinensis]|uniref:Uncharacterized protein n=1 Tax=Ranatra chinensis TaxID=642074 RepID=A0ABD0Z744_9HEMI
MASKRRNMFQKNKTQETTENDNKIARAPQDLSGMSINITEHQLKIRQLRPEDEASKRRHTATPPQTRDRNVNARSTQDNALVILPFAGGVGCLPSWPCGRDARTRRAREKSSGKVDTSSSLLCKAITKYA